MRRVYRGMACVIGLALAPMGCHPQPEVAANKARGATYERAPAADDAVRPEGEQKGEAALGAAAPLPPPRADHDGVALEASAAAPAATPAAPTNLVARRGPSKATGTIMAQPSAPAEEFDTEAYAALPETGFVRAVDAPLSTFSIDVDTASYSNVRRFLNQGQLPPAGAVRIEELINYFPFSYAEPTNTAPFAVTTEISEAPWNPKHRLLHVGLQAKRVPPSELPPRNLVFLLDVSGSMQDENKLPLLRRSLSALADTLTERDRVAIVVYAGASGLVLPPTSGSERERIFDALERLEAGGSTNGADGIELAYAVAADMARKGSINRVILATDGDFNVGVTSESELLSLITEKRKSGVYLSVLGFGMGNYKDSTLELLADKGNGNYAYVDSLAEARKVLVAEGGATLLTLAKDVKVQVEFNPAKVAAYRLIGYENRRLADRDFKDDTKDAGEMGAGHSVTALYEIVPPGVTLDVPKVDRLKYQTPGAVSGQHGSELCTLKFRYKMPSEEQSSGFEQPVADAQRPLDGTSANFRFSAAVAVFGMALRESPERGAASFAMARSLASAALTPDPEGHRREFLSLIDSAQALTR